ncbi:MAG: kynureninase, partial [Rhodospirillales bacterium]|nr:kynureninase [Rhodospirillales bacterium]
GDAIGRLIGAPQGSVLCADTTSINMFKALSSALQLNGARKVVLSDTGNFPSDLYIAQGLLNNYGADYQLKSVAPEAVVDAMDDSVAVLLLTEVDYRTGRKHDMKALTKLAHEKDILTIWDLCHSAGALPVDLSGADADFAVGCTYKYLNGGPGSPAFIYVNPRHSDNINPLLSGWLGHEMPFAFDLDYRPDTGIGRMQVGTPSVLAMSALDAALSLWEDVDLDALCAQSQMLTELFINEVEARCKGHGLKLASPRIADNRGSQVSFHHAESFAIMQALIAQGVIGDFRAPDIIRFGFAPMYVTKEDVLSAVDILQRILEGQLWDSPQYKMKSKVT